MSLKDRILALLTTAPGLTDRELTDRLQGSTALAQPVNQATRQLAASGRLERRRGPDGLIGNYLTHAQAKPRLPDAFGKDEQAGPDDRAQVDVEGHLKAYLSERKADARYSSFDYCFNYFQSHREQGRLSELCRDDGLELSCLHLGFYLASWGMFRGAADLLQRSLPHYVPLIRVIADSPEAVWEADAHMYGDGRCPVVFEAARQIRAVLPHNTSDILVTKIMLGVFGCVPAFDTYFKKGFGVTTFGTKALQKIGAFYDANSAIIEKNRVATLDFRTGGYTQRRYTRAKVIDMIFFTAGGATPRASLTSS